MSHDLADEPLDLLDIQTLETLASVHEALDPMPGDLPDRIKIALTMSALEAEIAELQAMSATAVPVRAGADQVAQTQSMTFVASDVSIMIAISEAGTGTVRIDGWVTCGTAEVDLVVGAGNRTTSADDTGRFWFDDVSHGPARIVVRCGGIDRLPIVTPLLEV